MPPCPVRFGDASNRAGRILQTSSLCSTPKSMHRPAATRRHPRRRVSERDQAQLPSTP